MSGLKRERVEPRRGEFLGRFTGAIVALGAMKLNVDDEDVVVAGALLPGAAKANRDDGAGALVTTGTLEGNNNFGALVVTAAGAAKVPKASEGAA